MLFLPKILALLLLLVQPRRRQAHGGLLKAGLSILFETLTSALLAPILMLFQSQFVIAILMRRNASWVTQQRDDHQTGFKEALATHGWQSLLAVWVGWLSYEYVPDFFWWFTPVLLGLVLAIPLSMLLSNRRLGLMTQKQGLFLIPEEVEPPGVLSGLEARLAQPDPLALPDGNSRFLEVITDPGLNRLHLSMLPPATRISRRRHHELLGLIYRLLEDGEASLASSDKRALLSNAEILNELHLLAWVLPGMTADFGRIKL
jgi:membrane glycosyltransferase